MNEFEPINHIDIEDESADLLDLIAQSDANIGSETLAHLNTTKSDFEKFLRDADLSEDLDAIALLDLIEDPADGDILNFTAVSPKLENSVTLRGNVAQPGRYPWHLGEVSEVARKQRLPKAADVLTENPGIARNKVIVGLVFISFVCLMLWLLARVGFTTIPSSVTFREAPNNLKAVEIFIGKLIATILIYFMQFGFIAFEAGSVRQNYRRQSAIKNLIVSASAFLAYIFLGWKIQQSIHPEAISSLLDIAFNAGFASTVALITANAITERGTLLVNSLASVVAAGLAYPAVAGWLFEGGPLADKWGFVDTAGGCVVHVLGAAFGLSAALWIGPRSIKRAWHLLGKVDIAGRLENTFRAVIGAFFLWFGWLGFNSGGVFFGRSADPWNVFSKAFLNTSIGASAGGILGLFVAVAAAAAAKTDIFSPKDSRELTSRGDFREISHLERVVLGMMGGLVAVTANGSRVEPLQALGEAMLGAFVAIVGAALMSQHMRRVDDPLGAIATHGFAGVVGVLCTGIFREVHTSAFPHGRFYSIGIQAVGCAIATGIGLGLAILPCAVLSAMEKLRLGAKVHGLGSLLRLTPYEEQTGKISTEVRVGADEVRDALGRLRAGPKSVPGGDQSWIDAVRVLAYCDRGNEESNQLFDALDRLLQARYEGSPEEQTALAAITACASVASVKRLPMCVERALAHRHPEDYPHLRGVRKWESLGSLYLETLVVSISELAESFVMDRDALSEQMNRKELDKSFGEAYDLLEEISANREPRLSEIARVYIDALRRVVPVPAPA